MSDDDTDLGKIPGVIADEQPNDMSLREFVDSAIRSPSLRTRRQGVFSVPELKREDLFPMVDPSAFPELSDETMRRIVEQVQPIIDEYWKRAEQMAQRCFIIVANPDAPDVPTASDEEFAKRVKEAFRTQFITRPSTELLDMFKRGADAEVFASIAPDDPKPGGPRW